MNIQKIKSSFAAMLFGTAFILTTLPAAQADDIDIYLQDQPAVNDTPLVIIALDLNLNLQEVVCSNILADPATLVGEPLCEELQQVTAIPVLETILDLRIGSLLASLLGESNPVGGLLGLLSGSTSTSLADLATALRDITNPPDASTSVGGGASAGGGGASAGGGASTVDPLAVALTKADVARLLLYRLLHQLVGVKAAVVVNNANTCETFATPRRNTEGCSNGAYFLLEATELADDNITETTNQTLTRLQTAEINIAQANADAEAAAASDTGVESGDGGTGVSGSGSGGADTGDTGVTFADFTPPFQGKEVYYEIFKYLTSKEVYNAPLNQDNAPGALPGLTAVDGTYMSPLDDTTCEDIYILNVMFTDSQLDDDSDADILSDSGLVGIDQNGDANLTWAEMVNHFANTGISTNNGTYKIKSRFVVNGLGGSGPTALLGNLVGSVQSLPLAINPLAVEFTSRENFIPVSATTASFGGPQTVFNRNDLSQPGDDLFIGLFKPEAAPAWRGNLKRLKLGNNTGGELAIVDANNAVAIGPDGKIILSALSFWTEADDLPDNVDGTIDGRDGGVVDRGGAGMFLIEPGEDNPGSNSGGNGSDGPVVYFEEKEDRSIGPLNLNTSTAIEIQGAFNNFNRLDAAELIAFARGYETRPSQLGDTSGADAYAEGLLTFLSDNIKGLKGFLSDLVGGLACNILPFVTCPKPPEPQAQQWQLADILHAHPLAIDYGNDDIRIFTGSNRGFLHQFRNEAKTGIARSYGGQEVWRLVFQETLDALDKSRDDSSNDHIYGVDGAPVAMIEDLDGVIDPSEDKVYLYGGLRRGGKAYYALDVTNPDAAPSTLWGISKTAAADSNFHELGLTFSNPGIGRVQTTNTNGDLEAVPVLVFGGGYDADKDAEIAGTSLLGTNDNEGNAIFIVNAETGALLWKARNGTAAAATSVNGVPVWEHPDFDDGIASDITALDTTGDGFLDRLYVGDTGGRLWRADIGSATITDWKAAPIANLGRHSASVATVLDDRRFFERPDVVRVRQGGTGFFALIIGSGNRASPLHRGTADYLYVVKDSGLLDVSATATPATQSGLVDFDNNCATEDACLSLLNPDQVANGWRIRLGPNADRLGEKALSSPVTISGQVLLTSYVPPNVDISACTPQEGTGRLYAVDLRTARGVLDLFSQDGEPSDSLDNARGTPMTAAGIPAGVRYIQPQTFLGSDFSLTDVTHNDTWRTYWRERDGER